MRARPRAPRPAPRTARPAPRKPLGSMAHLPRGFTEEADAHAFADFFDVENPQPIAALAGGVYLATALAPQQAPLRVGYAGEAGLLERPYCLRVVADDARVQLGLRPVMIPT